MSVWFLHYTPSNEHNRGQKTHDMWVFDHQGRQLLPKSGGGGTEQATWCGGIPSESIFFFWNLMFMECLFRRFEIISLEQHLYIVFQSKRSYALFVIYIDEGETEGKVLLKIKTLKTILLQSLLTRHTIVINLKNLILTQDCVFCDYCSTNLLENSKKFSAGFRFLNKNFCQLMHINVVQPFTMYMTDGNIVQSMLGHSSSEPCFQTSQRRKTALTLARRNRAHE